MNILLFDHHPEGGHHLPYAKNLVNRISSHKKINKVKFLTTKRLDIHTQYFSDGNIIYLYEYYDGLRNKRSHEIINRAIHYACSNQYDIIQFLHFDDITEEMSKANIPDSGLNVIANLNGNFFSGHGINLINKSTRFLLAFRGLSTVLDRLIFIWESIPTVPSPNFSYTQLYRCLNQGKVDKICVTTELAKRKISRIRSNSDPIIVPDPAPSNVEDMNKYKARDQISLQSDNDMLLFFGETRSNKGIDFLLDSLTDYDGENFTLVIAGPERDVSSEEICEYQKNIDVDITQRLEYIPEREVDYYFKSADIVILPYRKVFGTARLSGVLQRACASNRPVIASDFGAIGHRVDSNGLGWTYTTDNKVSLLDTIRTAINERDNFDYKKLSTYANKHTYQTLAETTIRCYADIISN